MAETITLALNTPTPLLPVAEIRLPQLTPASSYDHLSAPSGVSKDDFLSVMKDWSGTGQRFDVDYNTLNPFYKAQLKKVQLLGSGGQAQVFKITYRRVDLARKFINIKCGVSDAQIAQLKEESTIGRKLDNHHHIIKLVGTYWKEGRSYNILTYPVAVCGLGQLLDDSKMFSLNSENQYENKDDATARLDALDLGCGVSDADRWNLITQRLKQILGCITQALLWMHSEGIYHRDLKPPNILLRAGEVYLTDFGISMNRTEALSSTTERHVGHTRGYAAPEIVDGEAYNPRQADIFSLGCVFLHILTMVYNFEGDVYTDNESIINQHQVRVERFREVLRMTQPWDEFGDYHNIPAHLVNLLAQMLSHDRKKRPSIRQIDDDLRKLSQGENRFYGPCCHAEEFPADASDYHRLERTPPRRPWYEHRLFHTDGVWWSLIAYVACGGAFYPIVLLMTPTKILEEWSILWVLYALPMASGCLLGLVGATIAAYADYRLPSGYN